MTQKTSPLVWVEDGSWLWGQSGELNIFAIRKPIIGRGFVLEINIFINIHEKNSIHFYDVLEAKKYAQAHWDSFLELAGLLK